MANYKELLRRGVYALPTNNGAARRAVYEKAREALTGQLRAISPPLAARDVTAHRLQLEDSIQQVEQEFSQTIVRKRSGGDDDLIAELARLMASLPTQNARSVSKAPPIAAPQQSVTTTGAAAHLDVPDKEASTPAGGKRKPAHEDGGSPTSAVNTTWSGSSSTWRTEISPTVFRQPKVMMEADYASVMMPFSAEFDSVFRAIRTATKSASFRLGRADNVWEDQVIIEDVFSMIYRSRVVICDFSGRNPNVFYEAGIAHTLGRHVIPIVQNKDDIPFDIRHHRYLEYKNTRAGLRALKDRLSARLATLAVVS